MAWIDTPTGKHCETHNHDFGRGDVCQRCVIAPPKIAVTSDDDENEHDVELHVAEAELVSDFKKWQRRADDLWEGTPSERNTAVKAAELALKCARLRIDLRDRRAAREHSRKLVAHERRMSGLRRGN